MALMKGYDLILIIIGLLVLVGSFTNSNADDHKFTPSYGISSLNRTSFPKGFIFGTASAAYQYEGAAKEDGKGPSMWDYYSHKYPELIADGSNGDVAVDQYHRYKQDFGILKDWGTDAYRFSISWPRLIPTGKISEGVNLKGIEHYNNLINDLLSKGLKPFVTIFHWDIPLALEHEYGGFLSHRVVKDFQDFTDLCFKEFGDRVKHWITLNEPYTYSNGGYAQGILAPFRCSSWYNPNCTGGDSAIEPYLVSHHLLLAHAAAVKVFKQKYQAVQKGIIGITLVSDWRVPYTNSKQDRDAAIRALDFTFGWFMDPLTNGDYPLSMRTLVGKRLPKFTEEQSKLVKGSYDFIGINYYTADYSAYAPSYKYVAKKSYMTDSLVNQTTERNGVLIGAQAASSWLHVYPKGIRDLLIYTKKKYYNPLIYITENGIDEFNNASLSLKEALLDPQRIEYYYRHLYYLNEAIKEGVRVKGFFAWSFLDNYEWNSGYTVRFGIYFVDYKDKLKRYPKLSAHWFKNFLKKY